GLPPEAGLYACLVPMAIYAILGTSKHLVVGPVAIAALMVAAALGAYAPRYGGDYLGTAAVLCLQTGFVVWVLRVTQMGGLVNLLSHPVIIGFVNAAALLIILSQLPAITGLGSGRAENPLQQLTMLVWGVADIHLPTLATGLLALALLLLIHR